MASSSTTAPPTCYLLGKTPAELRNHIYDLVFTAPRTEITVELRDAAPPSKALLPACRRIYDEAKGIYRAAYCDYWTSTRFLVSVKQGRKARPSRISYYQHISTRIAVEGIEHIPHISVQRNGTNFPDRHTWTDGSWTRGYTGPVPGLGSEVVLLPDAKSQETVQKNGFYISKAATRGWMVSIEMQPTSEKTQKIKKLAQKGSLTAEEVIQLTRILAHDHELGHSDSDEGTSSDEELEVASEEDGGIDI